MEAENETDGFRGIAALEFDDIKPAKIPDETPLILSIEPEYLVVEESYQRDLNQRSVQLIRKIVENWDWAHFKPPIVAETDQYFLVIDGQHTAIAAATHPDIQEIPVLVMRGREAEARARAFVSQNRDRIALSTLQIFHAEFVAGDRDAVRLMKLVIANGGEIPRTPPPRGEEKPQRRAARSCRRRKTSSGQPVFFAPEGECIPQRTAPET